MVPTAPVDKSSQGTHSTKIHLGSKPRRSWDDRLDTKRLSKAVFVVIATYAARCECQRFASDSGHGSLHLQIEEILRGPTSWSLTCRDNSVEADERR